MTNFSNYTTDQIKEAILKHVSNQKKCSKFHIGYLAKLVNYYDGYDFCFKSNQFKRSQVFDGFKLIIEKYGFDEILKTDYDSNEILAILNK